MAKNLQDELKELRARVKKLEGGGREANEAAVKKLVDNSDPQGNPSRRTFGDACDAALSKQHAASLQNARVDVKSNPGNYRTKASIDILARKFQITRAEAAEILG